MFRLLFSTIIRDPQSSAKVTYVRCIYGDNGVVTACRFMWLISGNISHIKRHAVTIPLSPYIQRT